MKITRQELIDMNACRRGMERFRQQTNGTDEPVDVASLVGGHNNIYDLIWLACRKLPRERVIRLMCDCALACVELIRPYTDDYDGLVQFLKEPTGGSAAYAVAGKADRAAKAAKAARASARAANAAYTANEARAAARASARAANAAYAAIAAARAAAAAAQDYPTADAVVYSATAEGNREKVHQLLIDMFNEYEGTGQ